MQPIGGRVFWAQREGWVLDSDCVNFRCSSSLRKSTCSSFQNLAVCAIILSTPRYSERPQRRRGNVDYWRSSSYDRCTYQLFVVAGGHRAYQHGRRLRRGFSMARMDQIFFQYCTAPGLCCDCVSFLSPNTVPFLPNRQSLPLKQTASKHSTVAPGASQTRFVKTAYDCIWARAALVQYTKILRILLAR